MEVILKNKMTLILIIVLKICGAAVFASVSAEYLYGTDDKLFYFWRYGAFSLFGIIGGVICYFIPFEKLSAFFNKYIKWGITIITTFALGVYWLDFSPWRLRIWLDPYSDPEGAGYEIINRFHMFQSARLFGGTDSWIGANAVDHNMLTYAIERLGIVMLCVIVGLMTAFVISMFISRKKIYAPICKFIASAILLYIMISFVGNMAYMFNFLPIKNSHFPFLSYNRITLIVDLCLMGVFIRMTSVGLKAQ